MLLTPLAVQDTLCCLHRLQFKTLYVVNTACSSRHAVLVTPLAVQDTLRNWLHRLSKWAELPGSALYSRRADALEVSIIAIIIESERSVTYDSR